MKKVKVALVHDYLQEFGGAERVVLALHQAFPEAPLYVGFYDPVGLGTHATHFVNLDIRPTFLQKIPYHQQLRSPLRLLAPCAFARLDLREYDVVIASTNAYHAKAVRVRPGAALLVYCHTPARSLYGYETRSNWKKNRYIRFFGEIINHVLRLQDFDDAARASAIIANSQTVARRIAKFWRRESVIIHPPVEMVAPSGDNCQLTLPEKRDYYLFVNRLNFAKHPELAVQAAIDLDLPLKIVGDGPLLPALTEMILDAKMTDKILLLGSVPDQQLRHLYAGAKSLFYPVADEDFGIVPVEAMACGTPVIAHRSGGPRETIVDGKTGVFFDKLHLKSFERAIQQAENSSFDPDYIRAHAQQFSTQQFITQMRKIVDQYAKKS